MYTLLEDVEAETAADRELRTFLGQGTATETAAPAAGCGTPGSQCCVPEGLS